MKEALNSLRKVHLREYKPLECVVFHKTKEEFGGLSNMASGYPIVIVNTEIRTIEALYQACRFPHLPEIQRIIIESKSPMKAKMLTKPFRTQTRTDWNKVRVEIMRWCLRVKLSNNWEQFSQLLFNTGTKAIVEKSRRDTFWGTKLSETGTLVGNNVLGRLLMELREFIKIGTITEFTEVNPPKIHDFFLFQKTIGILPSKGINNTQKTNSPGDAEQKKYIWDFLDD